MTDVTVKRFDEMESALGGTFLRARAELGVTSFGMQVFELPPGFDHEWTAHAHQGMPDHLDFANTGQEEVYVPLRGRGVLIAGDERWVLEPGMAVRVGAAQMRQVITTDEPLTYLAIGGVPGRAFEPTAFSALGAGDVPPAAAAASANNS
jgi:uncharacterized cupin superfamily protein